MEKKSLYIPDESAGYSLRNEGLEKALPHIPPSHTLLITSENVHPTSPPEVCSYKSDASRPEFVTSTPQRQKPFSSKFDSTDGASCYFTLSEKDAHNNDTFTGSYDCVNLVTATTTSAGQILGEVNVKEGLLERPVGVRSKQTNLPVLSNHIIDYSVLRMKDEQNTSPERSTSAPVVLQNEKYGADDESPFGATCISDQACASSLIQKAPCDTFRSFLETTHNGTIPLEYMTFKSESPEHSTEDETHLPFYPTFQIAGHNLAISRDNQPPEYEVTTATPPDHSYVGHSQFDKSFHSPQSSPPQHFYHQTTGTEVPTCQSELSLPEMGLLLTSSFGSLESSNSIQQYLVPDLGHYSSVSQSDADTDTEKNASGNVMQFPLISQLVTPAAPDEGAPYLNSRYAGHYVSQYTTQTDYPTNESYYAGDSDEPKEEPASDPQLQYRYVPSSSEAIRKEETYLKQLGESATDTSKVTGGSELNCLAKPLAVSVGAVQHSESITFDMKTEPVEALTTVKGDSVIQSTSGEDQRTTPLPHVGTLVQPNLLKNKVVFLTPGSIITHSTLPKFSSFRQLRQKQVDESLNDCFVNVFPSTASEPTRTNTAAVGLNLEQLQTRKVSEQVHDTRDKFKVTDLNVEKSKVAEKPLYVQEMGDSSGVTKSKKGKATKTSSRSKDIVDVGPGRKFNSNPGTRRQPSPAKGTKSAAQLKSSSTGKRTKQNAAVPTKGPSQRSKRAEIVTCDADSTQPGDLSANASHVSPVTIERQGKGLYMHLPMKFQTSQSTEEDSNKISSTVDEDLLVKVKLLESSLSARTNRTSASQDTSSRLFGVMPDTRPRNDYTSLRAPSSPKTVFKKHKKACAVPLNRTDVAVPSSARGSVSAKSSAEGQIADSDNPPETLTLHTSSFDPDKSKPRVVSVDVVDASVSNVDSEEVDTNGLNSRDRVQHAAHQTEDPPSKTVESPKALGSKVAEDRPGASGASTSQPLLIKDKKKEAISGFQTCVEVYKDEAFVEAAPEKREQVYVRKKTGANILPPKKSIVTKPTPPPKKRGRPLKVTVASVVEPDLAVVETSIKVIDHAEGAETELEQKGKRKPVPARCSLSEHDEGSYNKSPVPPSRRGLRKRTTEYSDEEKLDAVKLVEAVGLVVASRRLGIQITTLSRWSEESGGPAERDLLEQDGKDNDRSLPQVKKKFLRAQLKKLERTSPPVSQGVVMTGQLVGTKRVGMCDEGEEVKDAGEEKGAEGDVGVEERACLSEDDETKRKCPGRKRKLDCSGASEGVVKEKRKRGRPPKPKCPEDDPGNAIPDSEIPEWVISKSSHGKYNSYNYQQKEDLLGLARKYGVCAVACKLGIPISTVSCWRRTFKKDARRDPLSGRKIGSGRKVRYGDEVDELILQWILERRDLHCPTTVDDICSHAAGIIRTLEGCQDFKASHGWAAKFRHRHVAMLDERTPLSQKLPPKLELFVHHFQEQISEIRKEYTIELSLIVNVDEIPIYFDLTGRKMKTGSETSKKVKQEVVIRTTVGRKQHLTLVGAVTAEGKGLRPVLVAKGKPGAVQEAPEECVMSYTDHGNVDQATIVQWIQRVLLPYTQGRTTLLVIDAFEPHRVKFVMELFSQYNVIVALIPEGCNSKLQPMSVVVRKLLLLHLRETWFYTVRDPVSKLANTPSSRLTRPETLEVTNWIVDSWEKICKSNRELICKSFKACGISNTVDGSETSLVRNDEYLDITQLCQEQEHAHGFFY